MPKGAIACFSVFCTLRANPREVQNGPVVPNSGHNAARGQAGLLKKMGPGLTQMMFFGHATTAARFANIQICQIINGDDFSTQTGRWYSVILIKM